MFLLAACLLGQLRFDDTASPPVPSRHDPYAVWRLPDGSWRSPMPDGTATGVWSAVPRYRWRAATGTVYEHPDREVLRRHVEGIDAAYTRRMRVYTPAMRVLPDPAWPPPARETVPSTYLAPVAPRASFAPSRGFPAVFCAPGGT